MKFSPILLKYPTPKKISVGPDWPKQEWSENARQAYHFLSWFTETFPQPLSDFPRLDPILMGLVELIRSPNELDFGISRKDLFETLREWFSSSERALWFLCQWGCPENSQHDECVKVWVSNVMARHCAEIVGQVETWRSVRHLNPEKAYGWFVRAMNGELGVSGELSFRQKFDRARRELGGDGILEWYVDCMFEAGGYWLATEEFLPPTGRVLTEEEREMMRGQGVPDAELDPSTLFITREQSDEWKRRILLSVGSSLSRPRLTEEDFQLAWNRRGQTLRELQKQYREQEKRGFGNFEMLSPSILNEIQLTGRLPLKWVAWRSFPMLAAKYKEIGEKNPPKHLANIESRLKEMARLRLVQ